MYSLCSPKSSEAQGECKMAAEETEYQRYQRRIYENRRGLAYNIKSAFDTLDNLNEKEFIEIVSTLDGDAATMSMLIEKFRKFKNL